MCIVWHLGFFHLLTSQSCPHWNALGTLHYIFHDLSWCYNSPVYVPHLVIYIVLGKCLCQAYFPGGPFRFSIPRPRLCRGFNSTSLVAHLLGNWMLLPILWVLLAVLSPVNYFWLDFLDSSPFSQTLKDILSRSGLQPDSFWRDTWKRLIFLIRGLCWVFSPT